MRQWTPAQRRKQADLIRRTKPWEKSTGPRTEKGKETSRCNAYKHGQRSAPMKALRVAMRLQRLSLQLMKQQIRMDEKMARLKELDHSTDSEKAERAEDFSSARSIIIKPVFNERSAGKQIDQNAQTNQYRCNLGSQRPMFSARVFFRSTQNRHDHESSPANRQQAKNHTYRAAYGVTNNFHHENADEVINPECLRQRNFTVPQRQAALPHIDTGNFKIAQFFFCYIGFFCVFNFVCHSDLLKTIKVIDSSSGRNRRLILYLLAYQAGTRQRPLYPSG